MEVKTYAFLQIAVFIFLGMQIFASLTDAADDDNELFTVQYCGMNCTKDEGGTWTGCTGKKEGCKCYHESGKNYGLCLSTEYTDFSQYGNPSDSEIEAAKPKRSDTLSH
uniref:Evasin P1156 n=1 Tax=Ixodes ricinus TaxID=34613 RepID=E1156_IXORI|nr:RecName: Full=Evasin P1156; Flags: Precursor [Ixodes ricinus]